MVAYSPADGRACFHGVHCSLWIVYSKVEFQFERWPGEVVWDTISISIQNIIGGAGPQRYTILFRIWFIKKNSRGENSDRLIGVHKCSIQNLNSAGAGGPRRYTNILFNFRTNRLFIYMSVPNDCPIDTISKKNRFAYRRSRFDAACFVRFATMLHASILVEYKRRR